VTDQFVYRRQARGTNLTVEIRRHWCEHDRNHGCRPRGIVVTRQSIHDRKQRGHHAALPLGVQVALIIEAE